LQLVPETRFQPDSINDQMPERYFRFPVIVKSKQKPLESACQIMYTAPSCRHAKRPSWTSLHHINLDHPAN